MKFNSQIDKWWLSPGESKWNGGASGELWKHCSRTQSLTLHSFKINCNWFCWRLSNSHTHIHAHTHTHTWGSLHLRRWLIVFVSGGGFFMKLCVPRPTPKSFPRSAIPLHKRPAEFVLVGVSQGLANDAFSFASNDYFCSSILSRISICFVQPPLIL